MLCERAIRDEGASHHYIKPAKYISPSKVMTRKISAVLQSLGCAYFSGTTWTTDAPYRETVSEIKKYQREGVATVDMEAAGLFAAARFRRVPIGALFTISDSLSGPEWKPGLHMRRTKKGLELLYRAALAALRER